MQCSTAVIDNTGRFGSADIQCQNIQEFLALHYSAEENYFLFLHKNNSERSDDIGDVERKEELRLDRHLARLVLQGSGRFVVFSGGTVDLSAPHEKAERDMVEWLKRQCESTEGIEFGFASNNDHLWMMDEARRSVSSAEAVSPESLFTIESILPPNRHNRLVSSLLPLDILCQGVLLGMEKGKLGGIGWASFLNDWVGPCLPPEDPPEASTMPFSNEAQRALDGVNPPPEVRSQLLSIIGPGAQSDLRRIWRAAAGGPSAGDALTPSDLLSAVSNAHEEFRTLCREIQDLVRARGQVT